MENKVIQELISHIEEELKHLKSKQAITLIEYINNWELQHIVERAFQQVIQGCIDIGARIIAIRNLPKPSDYHSIFDILCQEKIVSDKISHQMKEMVGLRNAIIHEYRKIEDKEVYHHLQESLGRFSEFIEAIEKFI